MKSKLFTILALFMVLTLILNACTQQKLTPTPQLPAPTQAPTAAEEPIKASEPTPEPEPEPELDLEALVFEYFANLPEGWGVIKV